MNEYVKIKHNNKQYCVINIKKGKLPVVLDWKDWLEIKKLNKKWNINFYNFVYCRHTYNGKSKDILMNDVVKKLENKKVSKHSIFHINKIKSDNRRENLQYDNHKKTVNKNLKKKKRTIKLPKETGIDVNKLPTYIWYLKPDKSHGERFIVKIGDINWKTTSKKNLDLKFKLEQAKSFLRELKETKPELFEEYSMNGEFNKHGKKLLKSYIDICNKAGFKLNKVEMNNITDEYLKPSNR